MSSSKYAWRQKESHLWQRDIDEIETFWATAARLFDSAGRLPFEATGHVSLTIDVSHLPQGFCHGALRAALRNAWCKMRYEHPTVASQVLHDPNTGKFKKIYRCLQNDSQLENWLTETLVEVSGFTSGYQFVNSDPPCPANPTMFIINRDSIVKDGVQHHAQIDLVLRLAHDTIDGVGILLLMGNFIRHISEALSLGDEYPKSVLDSSEVANLSPPYRVAAAVSETPTVDLQKRIDLMKREHVFLGKPPPGIPSSRILSLPYKSGAQVPQISRRSEIWLSRQDTDEILTTCKRLGVTVAQLFQAAIPLIMGDICPRQPQAQQYTYFNDLLCNLRPKCIENYGTAQHPVAVYSTVSPTGLRVDITVPGAGENIEKGKGDILRTLQTVQRFYKNTTTDPDLAQLAPHLFSALTESIPNIPFGQFPGPPPLETPSITLSSFGRVDNIIPSKIGIIEIANPWVMADHMMNGYSFYLGSHRGRINMAITWNDAWHEELEAMDFLSRCRDFVLRASELCEPVSASKAALNANAANLGNAMPMTRSRL